MRTEFIALAGARGTGRSTIAAMVMEQTFGRRLYVGRDQDHAQRAARDAGVAPRDPRRTYVGPTSVQTGYRYDVIVVDVDLRRTELRPLLRHLAASLDSQGGLLLTTIDGGPVPDQQVDGYFHLSRPSLDQQGQEKFRRDPLRGFRRMHLPRSPYPDFITHGTTAALVGFPASALRIVEMRLAARDGVVGPAGPVALDRPLSPMAPASDEERGWGLRTAAHARYTHPCGGLPAKLDDQGFEKLPEYTYTVPTGAAPGKRWKRRVAGRWVEARVLDEPHPDGGHVIEYGWIVR